MPSLSGRSPKTSPLAPRSSPSASCQSSTSAEARIALTSDPIPQSVDISRAEQLLEIVWEDGAHTSYTARDLRLNCPCADCRGEMGAPGRLDRGEVLAENEYRLVDAALVGRYAIQLAFESGHSTGIYSFRYLRELAQR